MSTERPNREPNLDEIQGVTNIRPLRRGRRLLTVNRLRRPLRELSDSEIERWAGQLVDGMAEQVERPLRPGW